ncbi:MAG: TlyA family RNA methyltransferase [Chloroflexota bacterium]
MSKKTKSRLDSLIFSRDLTQSREVAKRLILAGKVKVDGILVDKPGTQVSLEASIHITEPAKYVSRGGHKLEAALISFDLDVEGFVVADIGASTGGFTDCLLQNGAARIYAIDVGYGQLAWKLRQDPRVVVMDRTNARHLEALGEQVNLVVIDASFISLRLLLPQAKQWLAPQGTIISLVKPQFEAGRKQVGKGGVVRDAKVHRQVLVDLMNWCPSQDLYPCGLIPSPIRGPAGNVEFLLHCSLDEEELNIEQTVSQVLKAVPTTTSQKH